MARGYQQPLAAAYRTGLARLAERLVKEDRLRPAFLFGECQVERLDDDALLADPALAKLDPDLDSVLNVNKPDDYQAARGRPGARGDRPAVRRPGRPARPWAGAGPGGDGRRGRGDAAGLDVRTRHVMAALNGDQITRDAQTPLATGDTVFFMSADAGG